MIFKGAKIYNNDLKITDSINQENNKNSKLVITYTK